MSSDLTTYIGNKIVRWIGAQAMPTAPTGIWLALFNGDPKSGGTEVTTNVRTAGRVQITWSVPASGTTNTMSSSADADFGASASGSAVTVDHVAVFDASSSGNMIASKAVPSVSIAQGELVKAVSGDLSFTIGS